MAVTGCNKFLLLGTGDFVTLFWTITRMCRVPYFYGELIEFICMLQMATILCFLCTVVYHARKPSKLSWSRGEGKESLLETRLLQFWMPPWKLACVTASLLERENRREHLCVAIYNHVPFKFIHALKPFQCHNSPRDMQRQQWLVLDVCSLHEAINELWLKIQITDRMILSP